MCVGIYLDISGSFFLVSVPPVSPGVCLEMESLESTIPPSISMAGPSSSSSSKPKASRVSRYDLTWHAQHRAALKDNGCPLPQDGSIGGVTP